ncbi:MAG: hypothetical protein AAF226_05100, partial [Verrucomicrobiota bacterium]
SGDVPIIVASGNADDKMRAEATASGATVFMTKPFDLSLLRSEVADALQSKRLQSNSKGSRSGSNALKNKRRK